MGNDDALAYVNEHIFGILTLRATIDDLKRFMRCLSETLGGHACKAAGQSGRPSVRSGSVFITRRRCAHVGALLAKHTEELRARSPKPHELCDLLLLFLHRQCSEDYLLLRLCRACAGRLKRADYVVVSADRQPTLVRQSIGRLLRVRSKQASAISLIELLPSAEHLERKKFGLPSAKARDGHDCVGTPSRYGHGVHKASPTPLHYGAVSSGVHLRKRKRTTPTRALRNIPGTHETEYLC